MLLHGGSDLTRIQAKVEHVTAAPGLGSVVWLHTRWGVLRLDGEPTVTELAADVDGVVEFVEHVSHLGVRVDSPASRPAIAGAERRVAAGLLAEAASRGYAVARRARAELDAVT